MVIHGQHLLHDLSIMQVLGAIDDEVHNLPGLSVIQVLLDQARTASCIDKMIKADPGDVRLLQEVEYPGNFLHVHTVEREPKADLEPHFTAVPYSLHGSPECAFLPPEEVINLLETVQAYPHIGQAHILQLSSLVPRDQRAVGGNDSPHPFVHRIPGQIHQVFPNQGLSPGEKNHRHAEPCQIVEHGEGLAGGQFLFVP